MVQKKKKIGNWSNYCGAVCRAYVPCERLWPCKRCDSGAYFRGVKRIGMLYRRGGSGSNGWLSACQSLDRRRYLGCHFRNACFVYRRVWRLSASQKSHFGTFLSGTFQCAYCAVCVEICIWRTRRFLVLICISCHW